MASTADSAVRRAALYLGLIREDRQWRLFDWRIHAAFTGMSVLLGAVFIALSISQHVAPAPAVLGALFIGLGGAHVWLMSRSRQRSEGSGG
jgi:hypothetical protein